MKFRTQVITLSCTALASLAAAGFAPAPLRAEQAPRVNTPAKTEALPRIDVPQAPNKLVDAPAAPSKLHEIFEIDREGSKIGTTTIDVARQGDVTTVKVGTSISVKVMFIEAYRYEHAATETWKGGQLVGYKSQTDDNGTKHVIEVAPAAAPDKMIMTIDGKKGEVAKGIAPASLWNKDAVSRTDLFQPDSGKRLSIKVKDLGEEPMLVRGVKRQTHHYRISDKTPGVFDRDVWYEGELLVRMQLLGSDNSTIVSDLR